MTARTAAAGPPAPPPTARLSAAAPGWLLGLLAGLAVLTTLAAPGLTIDEPLDVRPGRTYVATLRSRGWGFFDRATVERVFRR